VGDSSEPINPGHIRGPNMISRWVPGNTVPQPSRPDITDFRNPFWYVRSWSWLDFGWTCGDHCILGTSGDRAEQTVEYDVTEPLNTALARGDDFITFNLFFPQRRDEQVLTFADCNAAQLLIDE